MMTTLFERAGVTVSELEMLRLMRLAGRFHLFLQIAGYHLCEARQGRGGDWRKAFAREARDHLIYLWEHRTKEEQAALRWVAQREGRPPEEATLEELERRGLVRREEETWQVFSGAFEALVKKPPRRRRKPPSQEGIRKTIDGWVDTASKIKGLFGRGKSDKG
jgi:hypothetical protein